MTPKYDEIKKSLQPLYDEALEKKLWFYCAYQDLWFAPKELRHQQNNGKFLWGAINWRLRDPQEWIAELKNKKSIIEQSIWSVEDRISHNL